MEHIGYHITFSIEDRRVIVPDLKTRRAAAARVLAVGRPFGLLLFNIPDDHGHMAAACSRRQAGRLAQAVESSLSQVLRLPVALRSRIRPIENQHHMRKLTPYILGNDTKHVATPDPLREASNLLDLLKLRILGLSAGRLLRRVDPRLGRPQLLAILGLPTEPPPSRAWWLLRDAACSAIGVTALDVRGKQVVAARTAACHLGVALGAPRGELASMLDLGRSSMHRALQRVPDPTILEAIERQLAFREALRPA